MKPLGIYFGPKLINLAQVKGNKLANTTFVQQSLIGGSDLEEKVPLEIKMVAALKDALRRSSVEGIDATLSFPGKDMIVRTFEVPVLPREEMKSAVAFEAKKYIPFKAEDLVADFQVEFDRASRINHVLYVGIKKETLDKYLSFSQQLGFRVRSIEYSALSLLRSLKLGWANTKGLAAFLAVDLQEQDEANFMILEDGFPLFSRDIPIEAAPDDLSGPDAVPESDELLEKIKEEIRVSLDYFQRKSPDKKIKRLILLCGPEYRKGLEAFLKEIGLAAQSIDPAKLIGKKQAYSLSLVKGYCAGLFKSVRPKAAINLLEARASKDRAARPAELDLPTLIKSFQVDYRVVIAGIIVCLIPFGWGLYRSLPLRAELEQIIGMRIQAQTVEWSASLQQLSSIDQEYAKKVAELDNMIKKQLYFTEPLRAVPESLPDGIWLTSFSFNKSGDSSGTINFGGLAFLEDSQKEQDAVNSLLSNLRLNRDFNKYFKSVRLNSLERRQMDSKNVTSFSVTCSGGG